MSTIDCVNLSNISLIGYTYMDERFKDELISNIHKKIEVNSSSFSLKSLLRDMKIDSLSDKIENFTHLLLDVNDVIGEKGIDSIIKDVRYDLRDYKLLWSCKDIFLYFGKQKRLWNHSKEKVLLIFLTHSKQT